MTTVYVVFSESASSEYIEGIFSDKAKAEEYVKPLTLVSCKYNHPLIIRSEVLPYSGYWIEEYELDNLSLKVKKEDIVYYWQCTVYTSSSYNGNKEKEYSVTKKAVPKQDIDKLIPYKTSNEYFLCSSTISEDDVITKGYAYYQEYLKESGKYDAGFWKPTNIVQYK